MFQLNERETHILNIVIEIYSRRGTPAGSGEISRLYTENGKSLSSATVRNVLLKLEDAGFLQKVHLSSGRIPTRSGYSYYIQKLIDSYKTLKIENDVTERLTRYTASVSDAKALLLGHLKFLTAETGCTTMLMFPDFFSLKLGRIEFVRLSARKIMVIMVSRNSFFKQVIVNLENDISYEELVSMGNYLNAKFKNMTVYEIKTRLLTLLQKKLTQLDDLSGKVLSASYSCINSLSEQESELVVEGMSNLFNEEEIRDLGKIHKMMISFEQKKQIVDIIYKCIDSDVSVVMNSEIAEDFAFVISPYGIESGMKGAFAVVGPSRMNYRKAMATMKYLNENIIETIIKSNFHL